MTHDEYRRVRLEAGLSQSELARIVGCHPLTISKRERGEIGVSKEAEIALRTVAALHKGEK